MLIDLDELVLKCRNEQARKYIAEAVACCKVGAYRACIVATWVAVVYDYINKLRDLELTGDKEAKTQVAEFEAIRSTNDIGGSLKFEKEFLEKARDKFELISPLEYDDLKRLLEDRNRCAHPTMVSSEEVYEPPAELARYHLRNAVTHLLQHPPVQGKAALDRLIDEVNSAYFPRNELDAITYFSNGPLAKPRESLVRNFAVVLLKSLFGRETDALQYLIFKTALDAVRKMHRLVVENVISERLNELIRYVPDNFLYRVIIYFKSSKEDWFFLHSDMQSKILNYVENMPSESHSDTLMAALHLDYLMKSAEKRLDKSTLEEMKELFSWEPDSEVLINQIIKMYERSGSFDEANNIARGLLFTTLEKLSSKQIEEIIRVSKENPNIKGSYGFDDLVKRVWNRFFMPTDQFKELLIELDLYEYYSKYLKETV